jgi:protein arginine kinase
MFIECQPGHIQHHAGKAIDSNERDAFRSQYLRNQFESIDKPVFTIQEERPLENEPERPEEPKE